MAASGDHPQPPVVVLEGGSSDHPQKPEVASVTDKLRVGHVPPHAPPTHCLCSLSQCNNVYITLLKVSAHVLTRETKEGIQKEPGFHPYPMTFSSFFFFFLVVFSHVL